MKSLRSILATFVPSLVRGVPRQTSSTAAGAAPTQPKLTPVIAPVKDVPNLEYVRKAAEKITALTAPKTKEQQPESTPCPQLDAVINSARIKREACQMGSYADMVAKVANDPEVITADNEHLVRDILRRAGKTVADFAADIDELMSKRSKGRLHELELRSMDARTELTVARAFERMDQKQAEYEASMEPPPRIEYLPSSSYLRK